MSDETRELRRIIPDSVRDMLDTHPSRRRRGWRASRTQASMGSDTWR